jgi:acetolactate synthase-1/2/3 large subunit
MAEANLTVAELFVRCLENEGVRFVFGVPGEENEDLLFALSESPVTFVPTRHEQGAAFMANVWGRLLGLALAVDLDGAPGARLANRLAQERARQLLAQADDLFLPPLE